MKKTLFAIFLGAMLILPGALAVVKTGVSPIFECWEDNDDGTYTAYFGYENYDGVDVAMSSTMTGSYISDSGIPAVFTYPATPTQHPTRPGRTNFYNDVGVAPLSVVWDGSGNIVWSLSGRTATASTNPAQECTYQPPEDVPEFGIFAAIGVLGLAGLFIARRRQ